MNYCFGKPGRAETGFTGRYSLPLYAGMTIDTGWPLELHYTLAGLTLE